MLHSNFSPAATPAPPPGRPKVYSYARWSTPEQAKGDSYRRQTEAARKWAEDNGLELDESLKLTDAGVSAYRGNNAEAGDLAEFLERYRSGLIEPGSILLVESLDRISRMDPLRAQHQFSSIVLMGVTIVTLTDGQMYSQERLLREPWALMGALMVAFRAHEESATKGRRVAAAWGGKRTRVRANPSERLTCRGPSWLIPTADGGWKLDPKKTEVVRRIFTLTLAGEGENKIAATFNQEDVPLLGRGKHWHRSTVSKVLRNPAVIGTLQPGFIRYEGGRKRRVLEEPIPKAFPPAISEADWFAVRALKDGKAGAVRGRHAGKGVTHVLAGLVRCPVCGRAMTRINKGSSAKGGLPKLVCAAAKVKAGCHYRPVSVVAVEQAFLTRWQNLLADIPAGDGSGQLDCQAAGLEAAIGGREDCLSDLARKLDTGPTSTTALRQMHRLETEVRMLREELAELEERRLMADGGLIHYRLGRLATLLEPEPTGEQSSSEIDRTAVNAALKVLFDGIVVDYQTGRLRFQWRQGGEATIMYAWVD